jgi:DNA-binding MarR family transcriptional regulator
MSAPLTGTESAKNAIKRVHYSHDAVIDFIIANPTVSQGELAREFNYTQPWISRVINSDAFKKRLAERKEELVDPIILESLDSKFNALADLSAELLMKKVEHQLNLDPSAIDGKFALAAVDVTHKAAGFGARNPQGGGVTTNVVVMVPAKAESQEEWAATALDNAKAGAVKFTIEASTKEVKNG